MKFFCVFRKEYPLRYSVGVFLGGAVIYAIANKMVAFVQFSVWESRADAFLLRCRQHGQAEMFAGAWRKNSRNW
jgi:hypothetical protein